MLHRNADAFTLLGQLLRKRPQPAAISLSDCRVSGEDLHSPSARPSSAGDSAQSTPLNLDSPPPRRRLPALSDSPSFGKRSALAQLLQVKGGSSSHEAGRLSKDRQSVSADPREVAISAPSPTVGDGAGARALPLSSRHLEPDETMRSAGVEWRRGAPSPGSPGSPPALGRVSEPRVSHSAARSALQEELTRSGSAGSGSSSSNPEEFAAEVSVRDRESGGDAQSLHGPDAAGRSPVHLASGAKHGDRKDTRRQEPARVLRADTPRKGEVRLPEVGRVGRSRWGRGRRAEGAAQRGIVLLICLRLVACVFALWHFTEWPCGISIVASLTCLRLVAPLSGSKRQHPAFDLSPPCGVGLLLAA